MGIVAHLHLQHPAGHTVGLVVAVVEVEVQVAEPAPFGHGVVAGRTGAFEHQGVDAVARHGVYDVLLHLGLVAVPTLGLVALGQPGHQHFARRCCRSNGVAAHGIHQVVLQQAEEPPPLRRLYLLFAQAGLVARQGRPQKVIYLLNLFHL